MNKPKRTCMYMIKGQEPSIGERVDDTITQHNHQTDYNKYWYFHIQLYNWLKTLF